MQNLIKILALCVLCSGCTLMTGLDDLHRTPDADAAPDSQDDSGTADASVWNDVPVCQAPAGVCEPYCLNLYVAARDGLCSVETFDQQYSQCLQACSACADISCGTQAFQGCVYYGCHNG